MCQLLTYIVTYNTYMVVVKDSRWAAVKPSLRWQPDHPAEFVNFSLWRLYVALYRVNKSSNENLYAL